MLGAKNTTTAAAINVTCKYCEKGIKRENFAKHLQRQHEEVYKERKRSTVNGIYKPRIDEDFFKDEKENSKSV